MTTAADQIGTTLGGRYRLEALLGTGASANVFLAQDTTLERQVAIKLLQPALAQDAAHRVARPGGPNPNPNPNPSPNPNPNPSTTLTLTLAPTPT